MANIRALTFFILFCLLVTHHPYLTNASRHHHHHRRHHPEYNPSGNHGILTVNNFARGGDGGGPSECDGKFHPLPERVVALSSEWFNNGVLCGQRIRIKAKNGRSAVAKVVDECDTGRGCKHNIVDASKNVWKELGLNIDDGEVPIIWTKI
ncbi:hypothetical protein RJT34_23558 [Clitoria ternatea]|uniref:Ripening-related protein grip22 n=1 Tax=Clitoria ternatea TaxID=43366 RepID=A0AAN9IF32_CLITE